MNVTSIQPLNRKYIHIAYISIIAALLFWATAGPSVLQAAAQDDDRILDILCNSYGDGVKVNREGRSETISFGEWLVEQRPGLVALYNEVGCAGISDSSRLRGTHQATIGVCDPECTRIDERFVLDGLRVRTDILVYTMQGDLEGTAIGLFTVTRYIEGDRTFLPFYTTLTYTGTMGDSDVGSFRMILSKICDFGRSPPCQGQYTIVDGSGQEAFESICGGGLYEFSGGDVGGKYDLVIRFGEACDDFDWTEIRNILENDPS